MARRKDWDISPRDAGRLNRAQARRDRAVRESARRTGQRVTARDPQLDRVDARHRAQQRRIVEQSRRRHDAAKRGCAVTAVGAGAALLLGAARLRGWA